MRASEVAAPGTAAGTVPVRFSPAAATRVTVDQRCAAWREITGAARHDYRHLLEVLEEVTRPGTGHRGA